MDERMLWIVFILKECSYMIHWMLFFVHLVKAISSFFLIKYLKKFKIIGWQFHNLQIKASDICMQSSIGAQSME